MKLDKLQIFALSFTMYLFAHILTSQVVMPVQHFILPSEKGAILYLPSSIRIIFIWLFGFYGFIFNIFSSIVVSLVESKSLLRELKDLPLTLGSPVAIFMAFYLSAGWAKRPSDWVFAFRSWQKLSLVAALGGFLNGVGFAIYFETGFNTILTVMIGDVLGLWVGYALMLFFTKLLKRQINQNASAKVAASPNRPLDGGQSKFDA